MNYNKSDSGALIKSVSGKSTMHVANYAAPSCIGNMSVDATEQISDAIDTLGYKSAKVIISYTPSLATGETISFIASIATAETTSPTVYSNLIALMTISGWKTAANVIEQDIDLSGYNRYIKISTVANMSASTTDWINYRTVVVLGGADKQPCSATIS